MMSLQLDFKLSGRQQGAHLAQSNTNKALQKGGLAMEKVWDANLQDEVETPAEMQTFLADYDAVCRKHGLVIGIDKFDGRAVQRLTESTAQFLTCGVKDYLQED